MMAIANSTKLMIQRLEKRFSLGSTDSVLSTVM